MANRFALTILLAALTLIAIQFGWGLIAYVLGIATLVLFFDDVLGWTKKTAKKGWNEKIKPRLRKEYDEFDKAKTQYPKGKLVEYGKKVAENVGKDLTADETEKYRVKGGLVNALTNASKAFFSEIDKVFKK